MLEFVAESLPYILTSVACLCVRISLYALNRPSYKLLYNHSVFDIESKIIKPDSWADELRAELIISLQRKLAAFIVRGRI